MSKKTSKFHCKSEAQKKAIRSYYVRKNKSGQKNKTYRFKSKRQEYKITAPRLKERERYRKVMAKDFPNDFVDDDEWDYIEAMATWKHD